MRVALEALSEQRSIRSHRLLHCQSHQWHVEALISLRLRYDVIRTNRAPNRFRRTSTDTTRCTNPERIPSRRVDEILASYPSLPGI